MHRRAAVDAAHAGHQLAADEHWRLGGRRADHAQSRPRARRRARSSSRSCWRRNSSRRPRPGPARHRRHHRGCRRSPGRRCRGRRSVRARAAPWMSWSHCAGLRSTPVGLWQQACSSTMSRAGRARTASSIASKSKPAGGRVVVGVAAHLEAAAVEHRAVVVPGGVADPQARLGEVAAEEVAPHFQCARAAQGLQSSPRGLPSAPDALPRTAAPAPPRCSAAGRTSAGRSAGRCRRPSSSRPGAPRPSAAGGRRRRSRCRWSG